MLGEILDRALDAVFGTFLRTRERLESTGDDALHHLGVGAVRGRTFRRIEHAESARCAGTDVEEPAATAEGGLGLLDGAGNRFALRRDRRWNRSVFGVYEI